MGAGAAAEELKDIFSAQISMCGMLPGVEGDEMLKESIRC